MTKNILVALPLTDELQTRLRAAVPSFAYRFTTQETATLEEILWADAILGNVPVELIRQNDHLEWFQSNFAGPDPYLAPGVLPPDCAVRTENDRIRPLWRFPATASTHLAP